MKAKIKETGEIVDVYHKPQHGQITNIYKESVFVNGRIWTEDELIFLNASEVKEVDLEKEIQLWIEDNSVNGYYREDVYETAKHFFELGLKAKEE